MTVIPPPDQHRAEWKTHAIEWIANTIPLDEDWTATLLEMFFLWTNEAFNEGTEDAAIVLEAIAAARPSREMTVAANAVRDLARRNRKDAAELIEAGL